ncbi:MAG: hypothetical protein M3Q78_01290, partial [Acidobacteriota bacterium]|nr:hypothetical protein [Acidobacteriota bacterium]
ENFFFVIEEKDALLTFKYKLEKGTALKSYGVYVAKLAGLPKPVVRRAEQLLNKYDKEHGETTVSNLHSPTKSEVERKLSEIDTDALSPVEALMKIYELKNMLDKGKENLPELKKAFG